MADKPLFNLDTKGRWRLAYNSNQWVLQKRAGSPGGNRYGIRESGWRGVSFVGSRKATLERLFREKGVVLTAEARARFVALPDNFLVFIAVPERFFTQPEAEAAGVVVSCDAVSREALSPGRATRPSGGPGCSQEEDRAPAAVVGARPFYH